MRIISSETKDLEGDVDENAGECRMRHIGDQPCCQEEEPDHERDRRDRGDLRASAGLDDNGRAGRTRIDGEGADQPSHDAAGANAGKVSAHIVWLALLGRKGACHSRSLHDANHRDDEGERQQMAEFARSGQGRKRHVRQLNGEWVEQAHAAGLKVEERYRDSRPDHADQRSWNLGADPGHAQGDGQNADAKRQRIGIGLIQIGQQYETGAAEDVPAPPICRAAWEAHRR